MGHSSGSGGRVGLMDPDETRALTQPTPDTSTWTTPSGRTHTVVPTAYDLLMNSPVLSARIQAEAISGGVCGV